MGKVKRGGYIFLFWINDHAPPHVHVYDGDRFLMKWDLEKNRPLDGKRAAAKLVKIIAELLEEGVLGYGNQVRKN